MSTALEGLKVVEMADEIGMFAGKLLADMGADVILVEPPGGHKTRGYEPFYQDEPDPERSLWFWYYNTSKRGITLNFEAPEGRDLLKKLLTEADLLFECERPGRLTSLGLGYDNLKILNPRLVMVSVTPYGKNGPDLPVTDLTIMAEGGPVWSCGYDDHSVPPARAGGNHGYGIACHFATVSALTALLHRQVSGRGQHVDVSAYAASNVTTEGATIQWLTNQQTVQRQTGRHASPHPTMATQFLCKDGRYVTTTLPPATRRQFRQVIDWLERLGLADQFPLTEVLRMAAQGDYINPFRSDDPETAMKLAAGREAFAFLAQHLDAYEIFHEGQQGGTQPAIIYPPEEALEDPHIKARGFPVEVEHPELGEKFTYPGNPYRFSATPWRIRRRAPLLGEDNAAVFSEIGVDAVELADFKASGII